MTCQHCQTWVLDEDDRCRRCGRRVRSARPRISPQTYPIAATATAPAYEYLPEPGAETLALPQPSKTVQQALFSPVPNESRVIPFDSLNTSAAREAIRAREAELSRPAAVKTVKVQARHARRHHKRSDDQRNLDFYEPEEALPHVQSNIICDAPVAPASLRVQAGLIDGLIMMIGAGFGIGMFRYVHGQVSLDRHSILFVTLALITIPLFYKLLWTFAGRDTVGMRAAGLQLVDFDGNLPSKQRRYHRLVGGFISFLAAGIGLIWVFLDQDCLTWHDHMSYTFPTITSEKGNS
ncbi:MAG: RDD family protein [Acidobacteriaceae bacterium]|nr:RDD family protein [Acidobacteriaceae bacterium]MBV9780100.1 RDD family protein [Acidobacteriaceae bacterium]